MENPVTLNKEEMLSYIYNLNTLIVQGEDVPDDQIMLAISYQRELNQHNLEKKIGRKPRVAQTPVALEDL